jgi:DNA-binding response OmpR family regulator
MEATKKAHRILVLEDDINLGYLLVENLSAKGFEVTLKQNGKAALESIRQYQYELCIIDIMLPEIDGFSVAETLRKECPGTPFIFLTALLQEQNKIKGFEIGADDYITKPFSFKELYYRVLVALRRKKELVTREADYVIEAHNLLLDPSSRMLTVNGQTKKLSYREAGLLQILLEHKGRYVNRSEILKRLWGNDDYFTGKSLDVYITRVRKLIKDSTALEIENLYGIGYRVKELQVQS